MKTAFLAITVAALSLPIAAANLSIDDDVRVLSINGERVAHYADHVPLTDGKQILFVQYEALFDYSSEDYEIVRSPVQVIRFTANADDNYHIGVPGGHRFDRDRARDFAKAPSFLLVDDQRFAVQHQSLSRDAALSQMLREY
ncbi:DUF2057 family protein [Ferrimonas senticii]|uniref:DUF2057 family protein n=1 Tax=Ferrimonas senticii TaxID=394566 RepID=UPI0004237C49|nr:DUF2057 family protein [Ferrimonas senticii]